MTADPLPPVHDDDPYYRTDPDDSWWDEIYDEAGDLRWWDAEVGHQWETR